MKTTQNSYNSSSKKTALFAFAFLFSALMFVSMVSAADIFVSPGGKDSNSGGSAETSLKTIQKALDIVKPGDTIHLAPGTYLQNFITKTDGTEDKPIKITGPKNAIISGDGGGRVGQITHSYYHLEGFTFDGLAGNPENKYSYRDKLLYVQGTKAKTPLKGLKITNIDFKNSGGEALRMRYYIQGAEVAFNKFDNIGVYDFKFNEGGKNGEAIYLGTSSNQWADGKNPESGPDKSNNNWIHDNYFNTQGNECVDIKEGAEYNLVERNVCTGQKDPNSGGLDSRSDNNIFRYNEVYGNDGAGIRIGGHNIDGHQYGVNNEVYGNNIYNNKNGGIKFQTTPQKKICGNEMSGNGKDSVGSYGSQFNPTASCEDNTEIPDLQPQPEEPAPEIPSETETPSQNYEGLKIVSVSASSSDENIPQNAVDGKLDTRWSAEGDGEYIQLELEKLTSLNFLDIAFYKGDQRIQRFDIQLSTDGNSWKKVFEGESSGKTNDYQKFSFTETEAKFIRIIGHENSKNAWNSITEVLAYSFF